jgi:hypothetical protein
MKEQMNSKIHNIHDRAFVGADGVRNSFHHAWNEQSETYEVVECRDAQSWMPIHPRD